MKRTIAILLCIILLPLCSVQAKRVPRPRLAALMHEYRHCEGVEMVNLGTLATAAIKTVVRASSHDDPDAVQALSLMKGVRRVTVFEYEDCTPQIKEKITHSIERTLKGSDLLMEAKDGDDAMKLYGVTDQKGSMVSDIVLFTPGDCALICIFGKVSVTDIAKLMENND